MYYYSYILCEKGNSGSMKIDTNVLNGNEWDKVIISDEKKARINIKKIWEYRDLIGLFVKRDFVIYYKQTILGPLWYLIQPLLSTLIYIILFGTLAKMGTDEIPQTLFYFAGTMLWTYFSGTLIDVSNVFMNNKAMFSKVYFPRMTVPIASMISLLIKLIIQLFLFVVIYIYYIVMGANIHVNIRILLFPASIIWLGMLACGIGMIISSVTTKYKDIALALNFLISLYMYATPVVYPLSQVPDKLKVYFCINPACVPFEIFRYSFFGVNSAPTWAVLYSLIVSVAIFAFGLKVFNKNEKIFVDVI